MRHFTKLSRGISPNLVLLGLLTAATGATAVHEHSPPRGVKLEVISVRVLSPKEEAERSPNYIGPNVAVRLRLSSSGTGFFLYSYSDTIAPVGYLVKLLNSKTVWLYGKPGENEHSSSPGIEKATFGARGAWLLVSGHDRPAIEWEVLDSTRFAGEKHAFTVFIKEREGAEPREIISEPYIVPAPPSPKAP
jgi:hypothetical protein